MKSKRFLISFTCLLASVAIAAFLSGASRAQRAKDAATAAPARPRPIFGERLHKCGESW